MEITPSCSNSSDSEEMVLDEKEARFFASIYRIRSAATLALEPPVIAGRDPQGFIRGLVEQHSKRGEVYHRIDPFDWGNRFTVWTYYSYKRQIPQVAESLLQAVKRQRVELVSSEANFSSDVFNSAAVHFVHFLWRPLPSENEELTQECELFALATGSGWSLVAPYSDHRFVSQIARLHVNPELMVFDYRPLGGNREAVKEVFKPEQKYSLSHNELHSVWRLFMAGTANLRPNSSLFTTAALQDLKEKGLKVLLGIGRIALFESFGMADYQELLDRLSDVACGRPTYDLEELLEVPDPAFRYLDNIERITDPGLKEKLKERLIDRLYQLYLRKPVPQPTVLHRYYNDYVRSSHFTLVVGQKEKEVVEVFALPPSAEQLIGHVRDQYGSELSCKVFAKKLQTFSMRFRGRKHHPLIDFFQAEIRLDGEVFFRLDGSWFCVRGEQLVILWRQFYKVTRSLLLPSDHPAALKRPWAARTEWCSFSPEEVARGTELSERELYRHLWSGSLLKAEFSFLGEGGRVEIKGLNSTFKKKDLEPYLGVIDALLKTGGTLTKEMLSDAFKSEVKDQTRIPSAVEAAWGRLTKRKPLLSKIAGSEQRGFCVGGDNRVVYPYVTRLNWEPKGMKPGEGLQALENYLVQLKNSGGEVQAENLTVFTKRGNGRSDGDAVLRHLKEKTKTISPSHYMMCGPLPDSYRNVLPEKLVQFLEQAYLRYRQAVDEEGYNALHSNDPCFLVGDRSFSDGKKKIELFDLLYWGEAGKLYLYHVKEGLDQKTRDACSQIRNAALKLQGRDSEQMLGELYDSITGTSSTNPIKQAAKGKLLELTREGFLKLFRQGENDSREIVFVYAFLDTKTKERLLSKDPNPDQPLTPEELPEGITLDELVEKEYLTETYTLARKGLLTTKEGLVKAFEKPLGEKIYQTFKPRLSAFNSIIARVEILQLNDEFRGFTFKMCQIQRPDWTQGPTFEPDESEFSELPASLSIGSQPPLALPPSGDIGFINTKKTCFANAALQILTTFPYQGSLLHNLDNWSGIRDDDPLRLIQKGVAQLLTTYNHRLQSKVLQPIEEEGILALLKAAQSYRPNTLPWDSGQGHEFASFFSLLLQPLGLPPIVTLTGALSVPEFLSSLDLTDSLPLLAIEIGRRGGIEKNSDQVTIDKSLQLGPDRYELHAVVIHTGRHYITFRRSNESGASGQWVKCDDNRVTRLTHLNGDWQTIEREAVFVLYGKGVDAPIAQPSPSQPSDSQVSQPKGSQKKGKKAQGPIKGPMDLFLKKL
ncbi:MAG: hypothetical protein AB7F31_01060 [Parachlamydiales bacterium]